jgi:signal transduction histidine kinase
MVVTALVARARVRTIVSPLAELARLFADIGSRSDLSLRLQKERNDEVGILVDAFNEMFAKIDERDRKLRLSYETLEETVDLRTAELKSGKEEAERANAAKSDFLATMSHEIRTPMNGMMVMAEMLSSAPLSPKHLRHAEIISRSGRGLLNIINDILDLSKIEAVGHRALLDAIAFLCTNMDGDTVFNSLHHEPSTRRPDEKDPRPQRPRTRSFCRFGVGTNHLHDLLVGLQRGKAGRQYHPAVQEDVRLRGGF